MKAISIAAAAAVLACGIAAVAEASDKEAASACKKAVDKGVRYLRKQQNEDGSYGKRPCVGLTGLCVRAMAKTYRKYREDDGPFISKAVEYILANAQKDGGLYNKDQGVENYRTCVAITALVALENPKYKETIKKASDFVTGIQCSEDTGYDKEEHKKAYGGTGYGGDERPDMINSAFAMEAMKEAGLSKDHPFWKRSLVFLNRLQHNTEGEGNDMEWASDDPKVSGGYLYTPDPDDSKAGMVTLADGTKVPRPYGSVTYAGVLSLIHADLTKDDPRVKGAVKWIHENYTVEKNPAMDKQGLYYYYAVMAKCLHVVGDRYITTPDKKKHDWPVELSAKIAEFQKDDGSWVNEEPRWWESNPVLVTSYSLTALNHCLEMMKESPAAAPKK